MYYGTLKKIKDKFFGDKKKVTEPGLELGIVGLGTRSSDR
jgi:hypothetical protein